MFSVIVPSRHRSPAAASEHKGNTSLSLSLFPHPQIMKGTETDYSKYLVLEKQMAIHEQWISDLCEEIKNDFCSEKSIIKF